MAKRTLIILSLVVLASNLACVGLPGQGRSGGGRAPTDGANRPSSRPVGEAPSGPAAGSAVANDVPAVTSAPAASSASETTASETEPLSESAYREAVRPLMRRLRDNGGESMRLIESAYGRWSVGDARERAANLKQQVDDVERELNDVKPPSRFQRAHEDLGRSLASQREFLELQLEAYDNWSNRASAVRSLERAGDKVGDAMSRYADAAQALNVNP